MNPALQAFRWVIGLGIMINALFFIPALFTPKFLLVTLGLPLEASPPVWLGNTGMLLVSLSCFYALPAFNPTLYPLYSWLTVISRAIAVVFWIAVVRTPGLGPIFIPLLISDLSLCLVLGTLLQVGMLPEHRLMPVLQRAFSELGSGLQALWKTVVFKAIAAVLAIAIGILGYGIWENVLRAEPIPMFADAAQHFKYGVIGLAQGYRVPYWVWRVLPELFPEKLPEPGNIASLGLIFEDKSAQPPGLPESVPVGFAYRQVGYPSVEPNCALCHTGTVRQTPDSLTQVVLGAPAHQLDLQAFQRFLYACASDPKFTTGNLMAAIAKIHPMDPLEALIYRLLILPITKEGLLQQKIDYAWQDLRPPQGVGRVDTFNPTKINVYHFPDDGTVGTTDLPQIWNQRLREGMYLHWDGNNNKLIERNYAAAMAVGATPKSVLPDSFARVTNYLLTLDPPQFPFPIDAEKAALGQPIFEQNCATCHAFSGKQVGQVVPIAEIATDRHRLDSFTEGLVEKFHAVGFLPWTPLDAYRKTNGYSNTPIDGIWARGPYLHNGSVPTLWDLLQPEAKRPTLFYRGYNVVDAQKVGFIANGPEAEREGFKFDVQVVGNGNSGHTYGTDLSDDDKWNLIEYLKTL